MRKTITLLFIGCLTFLHADGWDAYYGLGMNTSGSQYSGWRGAGEDGSIDNPTGIFGLLYRFENREVKIEHQSSIPNVGNENWGYNYISFITYLKGD